jgi:superfamily I DNA/RNA helicase
MVSIGTTRYGKASFSFHFSVDAYKAIRRYGRKTALGPVQREAVWRVYETYQKRLAAASIHEWADAALLVLEQATHGPLGRLYDDIVADEAQDLKPVDLRVIQLLTVPPGTLMVLGDAAVCRSPVDPTSW